MIEGPLSVNHQRVIERLYFFYKTCFSLILGVSKPPPTSIVDLGRGAIVDLDRGFPKQKSHLEIRSSYGSRDSFLDFWAPLSILIEDFQNKILQENFEVDKS